MRQIHVCACLFTTVVALAACSGEQFTSGEARDKGGDSPAAAGPRPSGNLAQESPGEGGQSPAAENGGGSSSGGSASASGGSSGGSAGTRSLTPTGGGDQGVGAKACANGTITFRMLPGPGLAPDYLCDAGCGTGWLTLTDAAGTTAFAISSACGTASCEACEVQTCGAAACLPTALTAKGTELQWTGNYFAKDTCGDYMACQRAACVKPGKYKARACAALNQGADLNGGCTPKNEQRCTEVEFEFPTDQTVELVLR